MNITKSRTSQKSRPHSKNQSPDQFPTDTRQDPPKRYRKRNNRSSIVLRYHDNRRFSPKTSCFTGLTCEATEDSLIAHSGGLPRISWLGFALLQWGKRTQSTADSPTIRIERASPWIATCDYSQGVTSGWPNCELTVPRNLKIQGQNQRKSSFFKFEFETSEKKVSCFHFSFSVVVAKLF